MKKYFIHVWDKATYRFVVEDTYVNYSELKEFYKNLEEKYKSPRYDIVVTFVENKYYFNEEILKL